MTGVVRRRPSRAARLVAVLLTLVAALLVVAVTSMFLDLSRLRGSEEAGAEALNAARSYAADMLSYDYRTIDQDLSRARSHTTGALSGDYTRLAKTLGPSARQRREVRHAVVAASAVESETPDEVRILMFVDLTTSRSEVAGESPKQEVSQARVRLVLVREDDRWLVSDLSAILGDTPTR